MTHVLLEGVRAMPPTADNCRSPFWVPRKSLGAVRRPSPGLLAFGLFHTVATDLAGRVSAFSGPPHGGDCTNDPPPWPSHLPSSSSNTEFYGNQSCGSCPREAGGPSRPTPPPPRGPASHLLAPRAVTPGPVKAKEGGMSHERCPRRPGQCQASKWQVPRG